MLTYTICFTVTNERLSPSLKIGDDDHQSLQKQE
jgi:hypothetical protein